MAPQSPVALFLAGKTSAAELLRSATPGETMPIHTAAAVAHKLVGCRGYPENNVLLGVEFRDADAIAMDPETRVRSKLRNTGMDVAEDPDAVEEMWRARFERQWRRGLEVTAANECRRRRRAAEPPAGLGDDEEARPTRLPRGSPGRPWESQRSVLQALDGFVVFGRVAGEPFCYRALLQGDAGQGLLRLYVNESCLPEGAPEPPRTPRAAGEAAITMVHEPCGDGRPSSTKRGRTTYRLACEGSLEELGRADSLEEVFPALRVDGDRAWAELGLKKSTVQKVRRVIKSHFRVGAGVWGKRRDLDDLRSLRQAADDAGGPGPLPWHKQQNKYSQAYFLLKASFGGHPSLQCGEPQNFPTRVCDAARSGASCSVYDTVFPGWGAWTRPASVGSGPDKGLHPFVSAILEQWREDCEVDGFHVVGGPDGSLATASPPPQEVLRRTLRVVHRPAGSQPARPARALVKASGRVGIVRQHDPGELASSWWSSWRSSWRSSWYWVEFSDGGEPALLLLPAGDVALLDDALDRDAEAVIAATLKASVDEEDGFVLVDPAAVEARSDESAPAARGLVRRLLRSPGDLGSPEAVEALRGDARALGRAMRRFRGYKWGVGAEDSYLCGAIRQRTSRLMLESLDMPLYPLLCFDIPFGRLDCPNIVVGYNSCYGQSRGAMKKESVERALELYEQFEPATRKFFDAALCPVLFGGLSFSQANELYRALQENDSSAAGARGDDPAWRGQPIAVCCGLLDLGDASWPSPRSRARAGALLEAAGPRPKADAARERTAAEALRAATHQLLEGEGARRSDRIRDWIRSGRYHHWSNPSPLFVLVLEWRRRSWCCLHEEWAFGEKASPHGK